MKVLDRADMAECRERLANVDFWLSTHANAPVARIERFKAGRVRILARIQELEGNAK